MFCPNCGFELDDDSMYCTECGYALKDAKAVLDAANNEAKEELSVNAKASEEPSVSDEAAEESSGNVEAEEEKPSVESEEGNQSKDDESTDATHSIPAVRAAQPEPSNPIVTPVSAPAPAPAVDAPAQKKEPKTLYIIGIVVGLAVIAIFSYQLFFNKTSGDVAHYGQDKAVVVIQESKITPTDAKGNKLEKYSVTLSGDNDYSVNAEIKGNEGFTMSQFPDVKPGTYTLTVKDSKSEVEWTVPVKVVDNTKSDEAVKDVSLEVPKAEDEKKDDSSKDESSKDSATAYAAYKQKCQEYLERYGEPQTVEVTDSVYAMHGFCLADLVDFDNDGEPELLTVTNEMSGDELKEAWDGNVEQLQRSYAVEVWSESDGGVKRIYSQNWLDNTNGGVMYLPLVKGDGGNILVRQGTYEMSSAMATLLAGRQALMEQNISVYGKKNAAFSLIANYESSGVEPSEGNGYEGHYVSEGKEISESEYSALCRRFGYEHSYRTYYLLDMSDTGTYAGDDSLTSSQVAELTKNTFKKVGIE